MNPYLILSGLDSPEKEAAVEDEDTRSYGVCNVSWVVLWCDVVEKTFVWGEGVGGGVLWG